MTLSVPKGLCRAATVLATVIGLTTPAMAQDYYMGEIHAFPFNWCPRGFMAADGQLVSIAQNTALFSLYGTIYGGNGTTSFGMPNLNGRVVIKDGNGPGLTPRRLGEIGGDEAVTLTEQQIPQHMHEMLASPSGGTVASPNQAIPATGAGPGRGALYYASGTPTADMNPAALTATGGSQPHENRPPFLTLNWCVVTNGSYPPRP